MRKTLLAVCLTLAVSAPASAALMCVNETYDEYANWHIGEPHPDIPTEGALWCVATSAELAYIQRHYTGLRSRIGATTQGGNGNSVIIWQGDDAAFILDNL